MDYSSWLIPSAVKSQCAIAIGRLQSDNEALGTTDGSLDTFINDSEIKSSSFDTMKQQISDYKLIADSIRCANESDIVDFETLQGAVGDEVLRGVDILTNKQNAENSRIRNEGTVQNYLAKATATNIPFVTEFYYFQILRYQELANADQRIYEKWQAKEDAYDQIESTTSALFDASVGMRSAVTAGISDIVGAFQNGVYVPNAGAVWRTTIAAEHKKIVDKITSQIAIVDAEGNIVDYDWEKLKNYSYADIMWIITNVEGATIEELGINKDNKNKEQALEKLKDWKIKQAIKVINQMEEYSLDTWEAASTEERKAILQQYMNELQNVYGIDVKDDINFYNKAPEDGLISNGYYSHKGVIFSKKEVSINEYIIENFSAKQSYDKLLNTVRHELRHGYQHAAVDQPEEFIVSSDTVESWKENFNDYKNSEDDYEAYRSQPVEADARDFGGVN